jgi:transposase-like protein
MAAALTLTFRHLPRSGALESAARDLGHRLQSRFGRITACHIVIEGKPDANGEVHEYTVKIHLSLPGAQIHADSVQQSDEGHPETRIALHAAFENAKRQLDAFKRLHSTRIPA